MGCSTRRGGGGGGGGGAAAQAAARPARYTAQALRRPRILAFSSEVWKRPLPNLLRGGKGKEGRMGFGGREGGRRWRRWRALARGGGQINIKFANK